MAHLALALLGPFQATLDGLPVEGLTSPRLRALLAYLAVESGRELLRPQVAALLWPEKPDREAIAALRSSLSKLHGALGDRRTPCPFLLVTRTTVQFNPASDHWLDVAQFLSLAGSGRDSAPTDLLRLTKAVQLYRGPFLDGLSVADSPAFDEWLLLKDEEYQRTVLSALGQLASLQMARAQYSEAARWSRRQLELEPYREQAHRQLMAALALGGERSAALAHYETCRRLLAEELSCEPEDQTRALYEQIRGGTFSWPQPRERRGDAGTRRDRVSASPLPPVSASRFVARERELARLDTLLDRALAGGGGVALIAGETGAGKTALLEEWARRAGQVYADLIVLCGRCNAHGGAGDPYLPFREILQTLAGDVESKRAGRTLSEEQVRRVWEALPVVGAALVDHGPDLIGTLVPGEPLLRRAEGFVVLSHAKDPALPLGHRPSPRTPSFGTKAGQVWQARLREIALGGRAGEAAAPAPQADLFAQVTQVLHAVSVTRPLLLAIDDLQWADGGTAALLFHLGRRLAGSRILVACAFRPQAMDAEEESRAGGSGIGAVLQELTREWGEVLVDLDQADGRAFVEAYVDGQPNCLGTSFRQALYDHTGGNPLFTVELLRSFQREGVLVHDEAGRWIEAPGLDWDRCPGQVEAVIAGHMASLPEEDRMLLQAASVQGERFAAEVAARVLSRDEEAVVQRLSGPLRSRHRLIEAVSLERLALAGSGQRPSAGSGLCLSRYRFRHSLVQRSAYRSLDAVARARLHEATAQALEAIYAPAAGQAEDERSSVLAPELARHYEAAGLPLEAARRRLEAGQWAARLAAYDEAIAHLERGLGLLDVVAPSPVRLQLEMALCSALVNPAWLGRGWHAPAYQALQRLADLTQRPELQDDPQRLAALTVLAQATTISADPERGQRVGEELLRLAQDDRRASRQSLMVAHWALGHSHCWRGQLVAARQHLQRALVLFDPEAGRPLSPLLAGDPGVIGRAMLGFVLWLLGYPEQGRASSQQALARAEAIEEPSSVAFAHLWAGLMYRLLGRNVAAAQGHTAALQALAEVGGLYGVWSELLAAQPGTSGPEPVLARERPDAPEAGLVLRVPGSGVGYAGQLLVQAQMCAQAGQAEMGLEAMDRAQNWIEQTGVRILEAEVWRLRGELLLVHGAVGAAAGEAEAFFRRAMDIARGQQARWLELRAAVSLARLWHSQGSQGRRDGALVLLAGIYGWFTEGFDTVDLAEAWALLKQLE